jgi:hypothetical protein
MDQSSLLSRRSALRLIGAAAIAGPLGLGARGQADAARGWCLADPLLRIGGQMAHVYISGPAEMLSSATDKILLRVTLPRGVDGKLRDILSDFDKGYDVRFSTSSALQVVDGRIPVGLAVYCPARNSTLAVNVQFSPVNSGPLALAAASGTADAWIRFQAG